MGRTTNTYKLNSTRELTVARREHMCYLLTQTTSCQRLSLSLSRRRRILICCSSGGSPRSLPCRTTGSGCRPLQWGRRGCWGCCRCSPLRWRGTLPGRNRSRNYRTQRWCCCCCRRRGCCRLRWRRGCCCRPRWTGRCSCCRIAAAGPKLRRGCLAVVVVAAAAGIAWMPC